MIEKITAIDTSHLLYRIFYDIVGGGSHLTRSQYKQAFDRAIEELRVLKKGSDVFITAFDDKHSWRTQYSQRHNLQTYKSNRYKVKSLKDRKRQQSFNNLRNSVEQKLRTMGGVSVLKGDMLEADDLLAGLAQHKRKGDLLKIHTLDKDLSQLTGGNISVHNLVDGKKMKYKDITERVLRGRPQYSVNSVFSNLPSDKYNELENGDISIDELFDELDSNPISRMKSKTRYKHNRVLLDVASQPKTIKKRVRQAIKAAF